MPVGIVSVVYGARCEVLENGSSLPCLLRGKLKQAASTLVAGDRVEYQRVDDRLGVVERILERRNQLSRSSRERPRRRAQGAVQEQVVLANPDQVVFVAAARDPGISFELMDRALALARKARLPAAICVNKMDLAPEGEMLRLMRPYESLGIPVVYASAAAGQGLDALRPLLEGRLSFFWGGSGVGKSSLIRAITGAEVKIGSWRTDNPRGPHMTNVTRLYPLPFGGLIADTPGFDWLELDTVDDAPDLVDLLLPEALAVSAQCRFPGCAHCGEPGCAVMAAILAGEIDRGRYARFRWEMAEAHPNPPLPIEMHSTGDELFFRMREGNTSVWTTFQFHHLFQEDQPEREGLLQTLGVPAGVEGPRWVVFQEKWTGAESRTLLTAKVTGLEPVEELLQAGQELILRERSVVKGIGRVEEVRPVADTWKMRKALKGTPIYETRAFWADLKPPRGVRLPPIHGATLTIGHLVRFEKLPELGMGVLTRQEIGVVLDFLEVGSSEDELTRE
jgi:ribosome biogenesis GTPase / thiamine phosphate phosphatase